MSKFMAVITGVVALLLIGGFAYLFFTTETIDATELNEHLLLSAKLNKTADRYAKCYNSVNYGEVMVGKVRMSYLSYESTPEQDAAAKQAEASFLDNVKYECQADIANYETAYNKYKKLDEQLTGESTWKSYLVGGQSFTESEADLSRYEPSAVRFNAGNSFTYLIFTEDQVKQYFKEHLGY